MRELTGKWRGRGDPHAARIGQGQLRAYESDRPAPRWQRLRRPGRSQTFFAGRGFKTDLSAWNRFPQWKGSVRAGGRRMQGNFRAGDAWGNGREDRLHWCDVNCTAGLELNPIERRELLQKRRRFFFSNSRGAFDGCYAAAGRGLVAVGGQECFAGPRSGGQVNRQGRRRGSRLKILGERQQLAACGRWPRGGARRGRWRCTRGTLPDGRRALLPTLGANPVQHIYSL